MSKKKFSNNQDVAAPDMTANPGVIESATDEAQPEPGKESESALLAELRAEIENLRSELKKAGDLSKRELGIEARERDNKAENDRLSAEKSWVSSKQKELSDMIGEVARKTSEIILREQNAAEGFAKQQTEVMNSYATTISELEEKIRSARSRLAEAEAAAISKENAVDTEVYRNAEKMAEKLINEAREKERQSNERENYTQAKQNELDHKISLRDAELDEIAKIRQSLNAHIENRMQEQYADLQNQIRNKDSVIEQLTDENELLRNENCEYQRIQRSASGRTMEQLVDSENQKMEKIKKLEDKIYTLEKDSSDNNFKEKAHRLELIESDYDRVRQENRELNEKLLDYEDKELQTKIVLREKESALYERDAALAEVQALGATVNRLQQTVNSLKEMSERPAERDARIRDITGVEFTTKCRQFTEPDDEISWLDHIESKLKESNTIISRRLLYAFHTSLKAAEWSPITVLAGVSGTGKSLLPKLYARFGGMYFLSLAVQPDWDSSQALLGYFNALDNKFNATKLLSAMVQFQNDGRENSLADSMMVVLLDEMNLAHVELYFSELLSKLEDRRGESGNVCIDVDLGSGLAKYEVELSRNILWTGTMNEDETTKTLSDKVIDRSNMLSFPSPKELARRTDAGFADAESRMLRSSTWNQWVSNAVVFEDSDIIQKYKKVVEEINTVLASEGRALGHRVWQAIEHYMSYHPLCIKYSNDKNSDLFENAVEKAFEEAVVFKIMPKLRGIEITPRSRRDCFEKIGRLIEKNAGGIAHDYNNAIKGEQFVWNTSDYLEESVL